MTDAIRISLSVFQQDRFKVLREEIATHDAAATHARALSNESVTAIVACEHDPQIMLAGQWSVEILDTEIVCTPPVDPTPA